MKSVCRSCHGSSVVDSHFEQLDTFVDLFNDKFAIPAKSWRPEDSDDHGFHINKSNAQATPAIDPEAATEAAALIATAAGRAPSQRMRGMANPHSRTAYGR